MKTFKRDSVSSSRKPQHVKLSSYPLNHKRVIVRMLRSGQMAWKLIPCPRPKDKFHPWVKDIQVWWAGLYIHTSPYLVFPFQHQQISDLPEGQSQPNNLSLIYVIGQFAYMDHTWRNTRTADVTFEFFGVVAIGCKEKTEADTIREGTEGSGSSWIMDWSSWQHKHRHDKHFNKKRIHPSMATPYLSSWYRARWICRKKRVRRIPSAKGEKKKKKKKTMVHFSAFTNEDTAWQVESTALILRAIVWYSSK